MRQQGQCSGIAFATSRWWTAQCYLAVRHVALSLCGSLCSALSDDCLLCTAWIMLLTLIVPHTHTHTHAHFMKAPLSSSHAQIAGRARAGTFRERTSVTLLAPRRTSEMRAPGHDPLQIAPLPTTCGSAVGVSSGGVSGVDIARDRRPRDRRPRQRQAPPPLHARPHLRRLTLARPRLARHPPRMATHRSVQRGATGNGTLASHAASIRVTLTTSPTLYAVPATRSTASCVHAVCPARDSRFAVTSVCWTCSERSTVA